LIVDSVLLNAKAYLKGQVVDCSIAIEEGKILKIGRETHMPQADAKTDLHGLLTLPGLIDEHVHLRDEGRSYKETFASGTSAAAAGGFTTVFDMPNNDPVTMSAKSLRNRIQTARRQLLVNVGFYSEFPKTLPEIKEIVGVGAVAFKFFMGNQVGGVNVDDDGAIREALQAAAEQKALVAVHAEDHAMVAASEAVLKKNQKVATVDYLRAHTEQVELRAIQRLLKASEGTEVRLHFCHVTSKEGLRAIAEAKEADRKATCEVTPNHLMLSSDDLLRVGSMLLIAPPLRDRTHVDALWKGIEDGSVDTIGSDHAPHALEEKSAASIWDVKVGAPGLETTLPLMLTMVRKGKLTINQVVSLLAEKPAEIFGLSDRAHLEAGKNADLTLVDFNRQFKIDASKFKSKAKFSPYNGWDLYGKVAKTIVNGEVVYEDDQIVAKGGVGSIVGGGAS
jgi:dihydroorotase (multifunctional complex type)